MFAGAIANPIPRLERFTVRIQDIKTERGKSMIYLILKDLQIAVFVKDLKTDTALEISPLSTVCIDRVEGSIHV